MSTTKIPAVIARLDRAIQYSEASVIDPRKPGVLDAPAFAGHDRFDAGFDSHCEECE